MVEKTFEVIPAIDILGGKCVRLEEGKFDLVEEYSSNPVEIAKKWKDMGATKLHVIDLDGARLGEPRNQEIIFKIAKDKDIKVQVGGGVRTKKTLMEYLKQGINHVVLGTKAYQDRDFLYEMINLYGDRIILGLDLKNKQLALSGWQELSNKDIKVIAHEIKNVNQIIYTDISRDGTLSGPNLKVIEEIAKIFRQGIIISGGISTIENVLGIQELKKKYPNITGVILGKSLYKGTIDLKEAIKRTQ